MSVFVLLFDKCHSPFLFFRRNYSLFHILGDYSLDLWRRQAAGIQDKHGLLSFIVHPDYLLDVRAMETYRGLLDFLNHSRSDGMWISTPDQVNQWWRQRSQIDRHSRRAVVVCEAVR